MQKCANLCANTQHIFAYMSNVLQGTRLCTAYIGKLKRPIILSDWEPEVGHVPERLTHLNFGSSSPLVYTLHLILSLAGQGLHWHFCHRG